MSKKTKNSVDKLVEMFADMGADTVGVYKCDKDGMVTLEPLNSRTGESWSMTLITSVEEAVNSKYKKSFHNQEDYDNFIKFKNQHRQGG